MKIPTKLQLEAMAELSRRRSKNYRYFAENHLKIRTKDQQLVQFKFNKAQEYIDVVVEKLKAACKPVRVIFLKARQEGVSTYCEGRLFHHVHQNPYSTALVVAQNSDSTENIFSMSKLYYDELLPWIKPETQYSNRKELVFDNLAGKKLKSRMTIDSAENKNAGRSWTLHAVHLSEFAFWPDREAKNIFAGIMQAVPNQLNTMVFIESTANGISGAFYDLFWKAWRKENDWTAIFIPWFWMGEYSRPLDVPEDEFKKTLTTYEKGLIENFGVTCEQINWYRYTLATQCNGDEQLMRQEFPSTPEEAFQSTNRSVFNTEKVQAALVNCRKPIWRGNLEYKMVPEKGETVVAVEIPDGYLSVWKRPEKHKPYVIGADVAEGLEHGDFSCADVLDGITLEQVAQWHGHIDPDLYSEELIKLSKVYNEAIIAVEANNHGLTTIKGIASRGYYRMYMRKEYDKTADKWKDEWGWKTTSRTKPLAVDKFNQLFRDGELKINCRETCQEMITFTRDKRGVMSGEGSNHDDRVMSMAIASKVWEEVPKEMQVPKQDKPPTKQDQVWERVKRKESIAHDILGEVM